MTDENDPNVQGFDSFPEGTKAAFMDEEIEPTEVIAYSFATSLGTRVIVHEIVNIERGFKHRLRTTRDDPKHKVGFWCGYQSIAEVSVDVFEFRAHAGHYDGILPSCFRIDDPYYKDKLK